MNKKKLIYFLVGAIILLGFYFSPYIIFIKSKVVCAKMKQEGSIKGRKGMVYFYKYNGKTYRGNFDVSDSGMCPRLDCYEDNDCLQVEVSSIIPSISRLKR